MNAHNGNYTFDRYLDQTVKIWSMPELKELEKELKLKIKTYK
jgi:hypothetical protein